MPDHPGLRHADETMHTPHPQPVHVETIHAPERYTHDQIERACTVAQLLGRGKLVLLEAPTQ
jgi:hypothetical protein